MLSTRRDDGWLGQTAIQFIYLFKIYLIKIKIMYNNNQKVVGG